MRTISSERNVKMTKTLSKIDATVLKEIFYCSNQDEQKMDVDEGEGSQPINESLGHEKTNPL